MSKLYTHFSVMFLSYERYSVKKLHRRADVFIYTPSLYTVAVFPALVANKILVQRINKENE